MIKILNEYNVRKYAEGVSRCLEAFGEIHLDAKDAERVLIAKIRNGHYIVVKIHEGKVASTATAIPEMKLIHGGDIKYTPHLSTMVFHIEDVATLPGYRCNNFAQQCIDALEELAEHVDVYKVILQCSIDNYNKFYKKLGYSLDEVSLRKNL